MITKPAYEKYLELVLSLTDEEKRIITDFDKRFATIKKHRYYLRDLIYLSQKLRKGYSPKIKAEIELLIESISEDILKNFSSLLQKEISYDLEEKKLIEKELPILKEVKELLAYDYQTIKADIGSGGLMGTRAEEEFKRILEGIKKTLAEEEKELSLNVYLQKLLDILRDLIDEEKKVLQQELDCLRVYEFKQASIDLELAKKLEENELKLNKLVEEINELFKKEKEQFIEPFIKFLGEKTILDKKIETLAAKEKITFKDIKADLQTFTRPSEVIAYQGALIRHWNKLDEKAKRSLSLLAQTAAQATEKERKKLSLLAQLALIDLLTQVGTKYHFERCLLEELERYKRYAEPFSLIMLDIDYFKQINDTYGHYIGDIVLKEVARLIKSSIRNIDKPFRYGGEEFAIILPRTNKKNGFLIGERIRSIIENESLSIMEGINEETKISKAKIYKITVSLGLATCPENGAEGPALIKAADAALYTAKERGRNRVCA